MRKPASCVLSIALSLVMTVGFIPSPALAEIASAPEPAAQSAGKPNESPAETTSGQARANDQISAASGTNVTANATQPIDASMFSIEDTDIRYTGNPVMPTVTSSTVPSDQYTVAYENNVAIGQATAVVTADDQNYSGTCAIPFEIKPANAAANYQHSTTAQSGDITLTVQWNDPRLGQETTFHVTATGGSGAYQFRMDAPTYMDPDGSSESVADPSRNQWQQYTGECTSHDYQFEMTASGTYYLRFYLMDKAAGVYYLRSNVFASANDDAYPAVSAIVKSAVDKCSADTDGSDYARALWLHDWTLDQLEYDHNLNWCSAESGLTRHQGTCESYQRIYAKLLDAAGIANGRITGNGHTWNAVKIDGKWCQMDLTWDDTSDNWYGDLDQRHLYFGLTDELMAIATPTTRPTTRRTATPTARPTCPTITLCEIARPMNGQRSMPIAFSSTWMPRKKAFPSTPTTSPSRRASRGFRTGLLLREAPEQKGVQIVPKWLQFAFSYMELKPVIRISALTSIR